MVGTTMNPMMIAAERALKTPTSSLAISPRMFGVKNVSAK